jgi:hypothetical protein
VFAEIELYADIVEQAVARYRELIERLTKQLGRRGVGLRLVGDY